MFTKFLVIKEKWYQTGRDCRDLKTTEKKRKKKERKKERKR